MNPDRILVVDDEPSLLRSLTWLLRRAGYEVLEARDGEEAIACILRDRPRLVFLDVMMPGQDGYDVLYEVGRHPELDSMRVVLLTAKGQEADRERGTTLGVDKFVTKPFSPIRILEMTRELLDPEASGSKS